MIRSQLQNSTRAITCYFEGYNILHVHSHFMKGKRFHFEQQFRLFSKQNTPTLATLTLKLDTTAIFSASGRRTALTGMMVT